jgi:asparagine synthase (glutamine-hydrolysing)
MCGICGIFNINGAKCSGNIVNKMNRALTHRGPDREGIFIQENIALAHRRLSIIDLSDAGIQPMQNKDKTVTVTFNGEIYNYKELRKELESSGCRFKSDTDTEVIVYLYEKYGSSCVEKLDGMFAFAAYNHLTGRLFLSVDRFGQKPLWYFFIQSDNHSLFAFSSELNSLAQHPLMPRELNYQAVHDFLSLQYIPTPHTIYKHVRKLPPGHFLELSEESNSVTPRQYWKLSFSEAHKKRISYNDACSELRELVVESVRKRLMSDVPLGAFLSGGLDSTIIVAVMRKILKIPVKTFTKTFNEKKYDESEYAGKSAEFLKTEHHVKTVNPSDFEVLRKIAMQYGEPFADSSMLPTYLLSRYTRENVKVALSGDGADEIFLGYYRYLMMRIASEFDFIPYIIRHSTAALLTNIIPGHNDERSKSGKLKRILNTLASLKSERYLNLINRFSENQKNYIYGPLLKEINFHPTQSLFDSVMKTATSDNFIEQISEYDIKTYLPGDILVKVDIASMAHSLEVRSPFMDYKTAEFAASLPLNFKQYGKKRKRILLDTFSDILPESVITRKKMGFGVPVAHWLRSTWKKEAEEMLFYGQGVKNGFFSGNSIEELFKLHCSGKNDFSYPLWAMLMLEIWLSDIYYQTRS